MVKPTLKQRIIKKGESIFVAGAWDEMSAIIFEKAGFDALKLGSMTFSASLGLPDFGLITPKDCLEKIFAITGCTELPLIVDFESGYGSVTSSVYWAQQFERAGATGIHIDDYGEVDKCPWLPPHLPSLEKAENVADRIKAMCDARRSDNFLIIARTGAPFSSAFKDKKEALEEGIRRSRLWKDAGADVIWGRAFSIDGLSQFREAFDGPMCTEIGTIRGEGKTSASVTLTVKKLFDMGYQLIFTQTALIAVAFKALLDSGIEFRTTGGTDILLTKAMEFDEMNEMVGLSKFVALREKYEAGH